MLQICSNVLLLTSDSSLVSEYETLAQACEVGLRIESEWNSAYRISAERIITTAAYLDDINPAYYPNVVLILSEEETFVPYKDKISFFIFNRNDPRELMFAFLKQEKVFVHCSSTELTEIMQQSNVTCFRQGDYNFNFDRNSFVFRGRRLYISESQQEYLAEWLINGHKDNKKRMVLYTLRQKFGKDFLADVDRFGQIKEEKNEL